MIQFNDIMVHDIVEFNPDAHTLSSRMIVLSRVDSIEDNKAYVLSLIPVGSDCERPALLFMPRQADIISNVIRQQAVPVVIEALERIASGEIAVDVESCDEKKNILVLRPERNEFGYEVVCIARNALRAVRGEESA